MYIRPFQLSDYLPLTEMLENTLCMECYEGTMHALTNQLSWDHDLVFVAQYGNQIVGMIMGTIENNRGYYYRVAVQSNYQNQGIGKALLEVLQQKFKQREVKKVMVTLDTHNDTLLPFYQALGFKHSDFSHSSHRLSIVNHA